MPYTTEPLQTSLAPHEARRLSSHPNPHELHRIRCGTPGPDYSAPLTTRGSTCARWDEGWGAGLEAAKGAIEVGVGDVRQIGRVKRQGSMLRLASKARARVSKET